MMRRLLKDKLQSSCGISRLIVILLVLVIAMGVIIAIPGYRAYQRHSDQIACTIAMKKAQDMLDIGFLSNSHLTYKEACAIVEKSKWEQDALCPSGGDYYLIEDRQENQLYRVTCGLHESDTRLRVRLNADHAYQLLNDALAELKAQGQELPEAGFTFTLNGHLLPVTRLEEDNGLRWGTSASLDYQGTVCFFSVDDTGELNWFVYADENHAAVWLRDDGWVGDAYR